MSSTFSSPSGSDRMNSGVLSRAFSLASLEAGRGSAIAGEDKDVNLKIGAAKILRALTIFGKMDVCAANAGAIMDGDIKSA